MSSTANSTSAVHRFKQVYVDIPPSPLHSSYKDQRVFHKTPLSTSAQLKENTPLRRSNASISPMESVSHKRKLSAASASSPDVVRAMPSVKKQKLLVSATGSSAKSKPGQSSGAQDTDPEYPNGFFYCHQCSKKRDASAGLQCTFKKTYTTGKSAVAKEKRCAVRVCQSCLRNRYGEDLQEIKTAAIDKGKQAGHVKEEDYIFKCPKCRDICNCRACRKLKGLEPTGNLTFAVRQAGSGSAAQVLHDDPKAVGVLPHKGVQVQPKPPKPRKTADRTVDAAQTSAPKAKTSAPRKPKAIEPKVDSTKAAMKSSTSTIKFPAPKKVKTKPLPTVKWTRLWAHLTPGQADERIQIREFILRFGPVMGNTIAKTHLEELAYIAGVRDDDDEEMPSWVGETCVKSIVLGLLGLLTEEDGDDDATKILKTASKDIRTAGASLNKIWASLATARDSLDPSNGSSASSPAEPILTFPNPLPAPSSMTAVNTRSTRSAFGSHADASALIHIASSAQMIPVILGLIDAALQTETIRTEIDVGVKDGKEKTRESREAVKKENERWEIERKELEAGAKESEAPKLKVARQTHKQNIQDLDVALKVAMHDFNPRFGPLGTDNDGRIYWALSPGVYDRDYALDFIVKRADDSGLAKNSKTSKGKRRLEKEERDRSSLKEWSWFVGVWGKKPPAKLGAVTSPRPPPQDDDDEDMEDDSLDDETADKWWFFCDTKEIQNLAEWISIQSGLDTSDDDSTSVDRRPFTLDQDTVMDAPDSPTKEQLKNLVKGLNEYATVLEWRTRGDGESTGTGAISGRSN